MQNIIALGHYSRTGKNETANRLKTMAGWLGIPLQIRSFADRLKYITHAMYGWAGVQDGPYYETHPEERETRYLALANERWPEGPTVVELWIAVGTPAIREQVYDRTWIDCTLNEPFEGVLAISDLRFPNEVQAVRERGGVIVKVTRPGVEPRPTSVADQALVGFDDWDHVINNDDSYRSNINNFVSKYFTEVYRAPKL